MVFFNELTRWGSTEESTDGRLHGPGKDEIALEQN